MKLFLRQLQGETRKLFARKRTFIGFGAFLGFELVALFLLGLDKVQHSLRVSIEKVGYDSADYLSGPTLALIVLQTTIFLLTSLFLALVAGDLVSKEVEDGSMRMMLCRPISRLRILTLKIIVAVFYTVSLMIFVMGTALLAGVLKSGWGDWFIVDLPERLLGFHDLREGLICYLIACPLLCVSVFTVSALALCLSCFNMKPAAATIITLAVLFSDTILRGIPYFEGIRTWFITAKMSAWMQVFNANVQWETLAENYIWLLAIDATLLLIGWQALERRDFKS